MNHNVRTLVDFKSSLESLQVIGKSLLAHDLVTPENLIAFQTLTETAYRGSGIESSDEETVSLEDNSSDLELQLLRIDRHVEVTNRAIDVCDKTPDPDAALVVPKTADVVSLESLVFFGDKLAGLLTFIDVMEETNPTSRLEYVKYRLKDELSGKGLAIKWLDDASSFDDCRSIVNQFADQVKESTEVVVDKIAVSTESMHSLFGDYFGNEMRRMLSKGDLIDFTGDGRVIMEHLRRTLLNDEWIKGLELETERVGASGMVPFFFNEVGFTKNIFEQGQYNLRIMKDFAEKRKRVIKKYIEQAQPIYDEMIKEGASPEAVQRALVPMRVLCAEMLRDLGDNDFSLVTGISTEKKGSFPSTVPPLTKDEIIQYGRLIYDLVEYVYVEVPKNLDLDAELKVKMGERDTLDFWDALWETAGVEATSHKLLYRLFLLDGPDEESTEEHELVIKVMLNTARGLGQYVVQSIK